MSRKSKKSFVGHRRAILFLRISGEGVFQQPQALTQACAFASPFSAAKGIFRQLWLADLKSGLTVQAH